MDISKEKNINVLIKALSRILDKYDQTEDSLKIIVFCNDKVGDVDDETQIDKILHVRRLIRDKKEATL